MICFYFDDVIVAPLPTFVMHHGTSVARLTSPWSNGNSIHTLPRSSPSPNDASKALFEYHSEHTERQSRFRSSPHLTQSSQAVCVSLPGFHFQRGMRSPQKVIQKISGSIAHCACGMWQDPHHNQSIRSCPAACPHLRQRWCFPRFQIIVTDD